MRRPIDHPPVCPERAKSTRWRRNTIRIQAAPLQARRARPQARQVLLQELARLQGIQTFYMDMAGQRQDASPETLKAVLGLWGISAGNLREISAALTEHEQRHWRQCLDPVIVAWDGKPMNIELRVPAEWESQQAQGKLHLEDGRFINVEARPGRLRTLRRATAGGVAYLAKRLALPRLPLGYHHLDFEARGRVHRSLVISAPVKRYAPLADISGGSRSWGIFLPMYAVHSEQSWGAGNLGDWRELGDWVASLGGNMISTLPLLAAFLDSPACEPSPYSPASRLFWNEFYLDIPRVPEFAACRAAQQLVGSNAFQWQLAEFRRSPWVDYRAEMAARRRVLELLAKFFFTHESSRRLDFERFLKNRPRAVDYAEFRATGERSRASWHTWGERLRYGKIQKSDYTPDMKNYHLYAQWLAQEQMTAFMKQSRDQGLQFYLDLPLGVHPDGYDLWRERDAFAFPASAGAPPDPFFTKGQDWGFAPLHPERIRQRGYRYVREYLCFQMRHTGLLRIDHVMGLHRLYWIPPGLPASQGAYVSYPAEELHALLNLESHRHQTALVGENLGTVPPEVNQAMVRHGLRQTYVVQYEQRPDPKQPLRRPPSLSVASLNTHDMAPFAAFWRGLDIDDRAELGLVPKPKLRSEHETRQKMNLALAAFLRRKGYLHGKAPDVAAVLQACLAWLAAGPAEILQINLEDLWQETRPQNVPGTSKERPNWRRKTKLTLEEIRNSQELKEILRAIGKLRKRAASHIAD